MTGATSAVYLILELAILLDRARLYILVIFVITSLSEVERTNLLLCVFGRRSDTILCATKAKSKPFSSRPTIQVL